MTPSWNLKELRDYVRATRPGDEETLEVARSVGRYIQIFRYHLSEARDAMKGVIAEDASQGRENLEYVFGISSRQDEYHKAMIRSEANLLACAHTARSLFEVFSHLINGLLLNNALSRGDCDIVKATGKLPPSPLKEALDELLDSHWFRYVKAFDNTAKHRSLVRHGFHVSFEDGVAAVRIDGFEFKGKSFPRYKAEAFLTGVLEVKNKVVDCGRSLNDEVIRGPARGLAKEGNR
ncbi:MAG: hypothetical protein ACT4PZ_01135 [Panacagrimonas sp.]